jgi:hypothetical protein
MKNTLRYSVNNSVNNSVYNSVNNSVYNSVHDSVYHHVAYVYISARETVETIADAVDYVVDDCINIYLLKYIYDSITN